MTKLAVPPDTDNNVYYYYYYIYTYLCTVWNSVYVFVSFLKLELMFRLESLSIFSSHLKYTSKE